MTILEIKVLEELTNLCLKYSRDSETFNFQQRSEWLIRGIELRERLPKILKSEPEFSPDADILVEKANEKIHKISEGLKNNQESLLDEIIQQIIDLIAIVDLLIDFRLPESKKSTAVLSKAIALSSVEPAKALYTIELKDSQGLAIANLSLLNPSRVQVFPTEVSGEMSGKISSDPAIAAKPSKIKGISIHIGLNRVDPTHYQGWDGKLNGCENDAKSMEEIARQQGYKSELILTPKATAKSVKQALMNAATELEPRDILLLTYSGHGGQIPDLNNDEDDNLDETWVLYDREFLDDELYVLFGAFKKGVRIFVLSDSCHSGTVTKSRVYKNLLELENSSRNPEQPKIRSMPSEFRDKAHTINQRLYRRLQKENPQVDRQEIAASVILISGCQDNQLSMDGNVNGFFTQALLEVWQKGKFKGTYRQFRREIQILMPPYQSPHFYMVGTPNPDFENQTPFTIKFEN
jgi:metacaspase-1